MLSCRRHIRTDFRKSTEHELQPKFQKSRWARRSTAALVSATDYHKRAN